MFSAAKSAAASTGYNISNSLRIRSSASAYLNRTPASSGNQQKFTLSFWMKYSVLASDVCIASFGTSTTFYVALVDSGTKFYVATQQIGVTTPWAIATSALLRDPSSWYHIVISIDTTQATAANRAIIYINGVQQTLSTTSYPSLNYNAIQNPTTAWNIGRRIDGAQYWDGYQAEVNFIDGQALTPSSFGSTNATTGVWQPAKYTGTYGTNGFYLKFSDIATTSGSNAGLGKDFSGNTNYWTTNNISVTSGTTYDAMTDSPTLTSATVANYCVINPLQINGTGTVTVSNGNMTVTWSTNGNNASVAGTTGMSSGAYYAEFTITTLTGSNPYARFGITKSSYNESWPGSSASSYGYCQDGTKANNGSNTSYGATFTQGDVISVAFDATNGTLTFYKNGTSQGTAFTGITGEYLFICGAFGNTTPSVINANFGQRPFAYSIPSGYVALNTYNLPTSTIVQGNKYMDATIYTGNASTPRAITNAASFQPDLVWIKCRSTGYNHNINDSVRGANKTLYSNATTAETANNGAGYTSAFNSNGFSVTTGPVDANQVNANGDTYVGWQWQAGQGSTSSNTSGTITSTVSVNATAGFSVVTYTGTGATATVGHGLGVTPKMIIVKNRSDGTTNWAVYHTSLGANAVIFLNSTATSTSVSGKWGTPSSTTFGVNTADDINKSSSSLVAYCWAEIAGFSKFGSYTGNGSTDGPFVYFGFRPKFVMIKRTDTTANWIIYDSVRNTYNVVNLRLIPNTSDAEASVDTFDFLANGFKLRTSDVDRNASGGTYIYAAFAENPFKNANAR